MIKFFDTLSGKLKDFDLPPGSEVKMYTCGPTVYDYAHIGNFRTFVFEDLLRRFLEYKGYKVKHVMNITDVDDKTIAGAQREGKKLEDFTTHYTQAFNEDLKTLNILSPTKEPRATAEIQAMIFLVEKLVKNGAAYVSDGSVYYRVDSFKNYGKLSKKDLAKNIKGARVDVDEYKKEEGSDFALWKKAREGEPSWDSPWGKGRPGWHVECSAMSMKHLGETIDIHAGGEDLIFPHHENEIAQSEAATGKPFVKYWLHSKHLLVNGEKMSKSKCNFYTLRDLLAKDYDPTTIRHALLSVHYRQELNFTLHSLINSEAAIMKLDNCFASLNRNINDNVADNIALSNLIRDGIEKIEESLSDDLKVSAALAWVFECARAINRTVAERSCSTKDIKEAVTFFKRVDALFGFDISDVGVPPSNITRLLVEQQTLRKRGNFQEATKIRDQIIQKGWLVKDGKPDELSTVKQKRRAWDK